MDKTGLDPWSRVSLLCSGVELEIEYIFYKVFRNNKCTVDFQKSTDRDSPRFGISAILK